MKLLITGVCGFAGSTLAASLLEARPGLEIIGIDNFMRPGSELNREPLRSLGVQVRHADLRMAEDIDALPKVDCVIDAAANPSVLAGTANSGFSSSRALMQHNLLGTVNILEYCRQHRASFILLSTSRVYSINGLAGVQLGVQDNAFHPDTNQQWPTGLSADGVNESFSTGAPVSLYGATKVCSEKLALEYGAAFDFPVWINRLGVLAGAGQFGKADQGIFSFWVHSCAQKRPLSFIGFGGCGYQVRDCLHPRDLTEVLAEQMASSPEEGGAITNFSGGAENSMSLQQLHRWCEDRFGKLSVRSVAENRPYDVPWLVLDPAAASTRFRWRPATKIETVLEEIATHAEENPKWLEMTTNV